MSQCLCGLWAGEGERVLGEVLVPWGETREGGRDVHPDRGQLRGLPRPPSSSSLQPGLRSSDGPGACHEGQAIFTPLASRRALLRRAPLNPPQQRPPNLYPGWGCSFDPVRLGLALDRSLETQGLARPALGHCAPLSKSPLRPLPPCLRRAPRLPLLP